MSDDEEDLADAEEAKPAAAAPSVTAAAGYLPGVQSIANFNPNEQSVGVALPPEPTGAEYAQAIGAAIARGVTLGASDPALIAAGIRSEKLRELKAKTPLLSAGG